MADIDATFRLSLDTSLRAVSSDAEKRYGDASQLYCKTLELFYKMLQDPRLPPSHRSSVIAKAHEYAGRVVELEQLLPPTKRIAVEPENMNVGPPVVTTVPDRSTDTPTGLDLESRIASLKQPTAEEAIHARIGGLVGRESTINGTSGADNGRASSFLSDRRATASITVSSLPTDLGQEIMNAINDTREELYLDGLVSDKGTHMLNTATPSTAACANDILSRVIEEIHLEESQQVSRCSKEGQEQQHQHQSGGKKAPQSGIDVPKSCGVGAMNDVVPEAPSDGVLEKLARRQERRQRRERRTKKRGRRARRAKQRNMYDGGLSSDDSSDDSISSDSSSDSDDDDGDDDTGLNIVARAKCLLSEFGD